MSSEEQVVWQGSPSQVTNLGTFLLSGLALVLVVVLAVFAGPWALVLLVVPLGWALYKWVDLMNFRYEVTTERIRLSRGILSKSHDELELYRVKDSTLEQPFFLRLFGLGNIVLDTSDRSTPVFTFKAVQDADALRDELRTHVEARRTAKQVREVDFE